MNDVYEALIQLLFEASLAGLVGGGGRAFVEKEKIKNYIERCFAGLIFSIFLGYVFRDTELLLREGGGYNFLGHSVFFTTGCFTKEVILIFAGMGKRVLSMLSPKNNNNEPPDSSDGHA